MGGTRRIDDAIDLVSWYEKQDHRCTTLTDNAIALELLWTRGAPKRHGGERSGKTAKEPYGDAARVREARRFVDHDKSGLFTDLWFGTRENGGGRSLSRLHDATSAYDEPGLALHVAAQVARATQMVRQHESERDTRILPTLRDIADTLQQNKAPVKLVIAMHDVVRDMEDRGRILPATQWALIKAGVKWQEGNA